MTEYSNRAINPKGHQPITWRECPFRAHNMPHSSHDPACSPEEFICKAGGDFLLGRHDGGADAICSACDIPRSLNKQYACLFLVPFRVFQNEHVKSYYSCRWSLDIHARNVPKNNDWCKGCVHWFPWPPDFEIPNLFSYCQKALELFLKDMQRESSPP